MSWASMMGSFMSMLSSLSYLLSSFKMAPFGLLCFTMSWLTGGIIILSLLSSEKKKEVLWWSLFSIATLSFFTMTLFKFYILFELSLVPILLMILVFGSQPERLSSGAYLLFYTTAISIPYIVMLVLLKLSTTSIWEEAMLTTTVFMSFLITFPFLVKMPIFSLHFWLPKAHVEANTSGSMVLAGLLLKLGSYGVLRSSAILMASNSAMLYLYTWLILSIFSSMVTFFQTDLKKLIAYSSVTHMTFMMVGLSMGSKVALFSTVLLSLAHGWAASGMFFMAGTLSQATASRMEYILSAEFGLSWFSILLGVLLVSNASIPPMPSFFPELLMVLNLFSSNVVLTATFMFLSLFVCYYNSFLFIISFHSKPLSFSGASSKLLSSVLMSTFVSISLLSLLWVSEF